MFCPKCGVKLKGDVHEIQLNEAEVSTVNSKLEEHGTSVNTSNNDDFYGICPHCGYSIPHHLNEDELKKLNQVAHAKFHSARNKWNTGMCGIVAGAILFLIAAIFFVLCFKVAENYRFSTEGEPFIVFVALTAISVGLFIFGSIFVGIANNNKKCYSNLIKDISNKTFIQ